MEPELGQPEAGDGLSGPDNGADAEDGVAGRGRWSGILGRTVWRESWKKFSLIKK